MSASTTFDYAALIVRERDALLKDLETLRGYVENVSPTSGIPFEIQSSITNRLHTLLHWKRELDKGVIPKTLAKKPKILTSFIDKIHAFHDFMESDKTTLYVFLTADNDVESCTALGEVVHPDCRGFSWSCVIHTNGPDAETYTKGSPDKPAKHVYYLSEGDEALATEQNSERLYMGPDHFHAKHERGAKVHSTMEEKVSVYEDFFALGEQVLIIVGANGGGEGKSLALTQVKKRPAVTLVSAAGEEPVHMPAIGYADGEEVPGDTMVYHLSKADETLIQILEEKYNARTVYFGLATE